jgi:hypothetical protein
VLRALDDAASELGEVAALERLVGEKDVAEVALVSAVESGR